MLLLCFVVSISFLLNFVTFSQGTSVVQLLSGTNLDDHASSYFSAVESFERVARSVIVELGTCGPSETSLALDAAAAAAATTGIIFSLPNSFVTSKNGGRLILSTL